MHYVLADDRARDFSRRSGHLSGGAAASHRQSGPAAAHGLAGGGGRQASRAWSRPGTWGLPLVLTFGATGALTAGAGD